MDVVYDGSGAFLLNDRDLGAVRVKLEEPTNTFLEKISNRAQHQPVPSTMGHI